MGFVTCGDRPSCTAQHFAMRLVSMEHGAAQPGVGQQGWGYTIW